MKKWFAVLCFGLAVNLHAAENKLNVADVSPKIDIKKHWAVNPWHDLMYIIENPTHVKLNFIIEMNPTTKDFFGNLVPSAPVKLTCGHQEFFITEYKPMGSVVCATRDDIRIDLVDIKGNPSAGKYELQFSR